MGQACPARATIRHCCIRHLRAVTRRVDTRDAADHDRQRHLLWHQRRQDGRGGCPDSLSIRRVVQRHQPQSAAGGGFAIASTQCVAEPGLLAACPFQRQIGDGHCWASGTDLHCSVLLRDGALLRFAAAAERHRRAVVSRLVWADRTVTGFHRPLRAAARLGRRLRSLHAGAGAARTSRAGPRAQHPPDRRSRRWADILQPLLRPAVECHLGDELGGAAGRCGVQPAAHQGHRLALRCARRHRGSTGGQRAVALLLHVDPVDRTRLLQRGVGACVQFRI
jgi:hypothetical protein